MVYYIIERYASNEEVKWVSSVGESVRRWESSLQTGANDNDRLQRSTRRS